MHSVLIVDDSGFFRDLGSRMESQLPCRLLSAASGSEALNMARREGPDLICLDADMTGMTGIDVCRVLKADSRFAHTPVIVVSGGKHSEEEIRRAGADEWIFKPLEDAILFDAARKHLKLDPRAGTRTAVGWPVIFWRDGVQHDGTLRDLSRGGFFIRTPIRQPVGARLEISFEVPVGKPGRTIVAEAIVVRIASDPDQGLGCRFFRITGRPRAHLEDCLKTLEIKE